MKMGTSYGYITGFIPVSGVMPTTNVTIKVPIIMVSS